MNQETFHLYHHQPYPLAADAIDDQAWLINNGMTYSVVATIRAPAPEKAYEGLLAKMQDHSLRSVEVKMSNIVRATLPGDVLVGEKKAWMILPGRQLHLIPYKPGTPWKSFMHDSFVKCLSWAPDGKHLVASSNQVLLHTLSSDDEPRSVATSYNRHGNHTICAVAWSPDGKHIASGGYDAEVHIWKPYPEGGPRRAALGSLLVCRTPEMEKSYEPEITSLTWAHDSRTILAGRGDGSLVQWDTSTGECLHILHHHRKEVIALAYAPDGIRIASTSKDGSLRIWSIEYADQEVICQHRGKVSAFAWSPDGSLLVSACQGEQSLQCWNALAGSPGERIPVSTYSTELPNIEAITWSPDGRFLGAGCDDGTLQIIDMRSRRHVQTYRTAHAQAACVAWSPDGQFLASGKGGSYAVQIWRTQAGAPTDQEGDARTSLLSSSE